METTPLTMESPNIKEIFNLSLKCKGTGYYKKLIEGNTGIYLASPIFGHRDYNKSRVMDKTPHNIKLMNEFNHRLEQIN